MYWTEEERSWTCNCLVSGSQLDHVAGEEARHISCTIKYTEWAGYDPDLWDLQLPQQHSKAGWVQCLNGQYYSSKAKAAVGNYCHKVIGGWGEQLAHHLGPAPRETTTNLFTLCSSRLLPFWPRVGWYASLTLWRSGVVPLDWQTRVMVPLFKKRDW